MLFLTLSHTSCCQVGPNSAEFPVENAPNRTLHATAIQGENSVSDLLMNTPYSLSFWYTYELITVKIPPSTACSTFDLRNTWLTGFLSWNKMRGISAASVAGISVRGRSQMLRPTYDSIQSTIDDYITSDSREFNAVDALSKTGIVPILVLMMAHMLTNNQCIHLSLVTATTSWPFVLLGSFIYRQSSMQDCVKAAALADFIQWTQMSTYASQIATRYPTSLVFIQHNSHVTNARQGFFVASTIPYLRSRFLDLMVNFTCNGTSVSTISNCVSQGKLCSDRGTCTGNTCLCNDDACGKYCEKTCTKTTSRTLIFVLGTFIFCRC